MDAVQIIAIKHVEREHLQCSVTSVLNIAREHPQRSVMSVLTNDDTGRRQQKATPSSDPDRVTGAETQTQATKQKSDVNKTRRNVRLEPKTTYIMYVIVYQHILYQSISYHF